MNTQAQKAAAFRALHEREGAFIIPNPWDAGTARLLAALGFEEALGYTVDELVRDKDGVSAAVLFAELAAVLRASDVSVLSHLEGLYRRYGLFTSSQVNVTRKGAEGIAELRGPGVPSVRVAAS